MIAKIRENGMVTQMGVTNNEKKYVPRRIKGHTNQS